MEMVYMEEHVPTAEEKSDHFLYANNVRSEMAEALGVPVTDHCYDDVRLLVKAHHEAYVLKHVTSKITSKTLRHVAHLSRDESLELLKNFIAADTDKSGTIDLQEFTAVLKADGQDRSPFPSRAGSRDLVAPVAHCHLALSRYVYLE